MRKEHLEDYDDNGIDNIEEATIDGNPDNPELCLEIEEKIKELSD